MYHLAAHQLHDLFIKGEASATEIVEQFLKRIETYESKTQAFLSVLSEQSLAQAKQLDNKRSQKKQIGKLAGIPIGLKDNIHLLNEVTTCGSKFLSNYKALFNATVTRLVQEEDGLIIGKTNLDEFGMGSSTENSAYQISRNPWNLKCTPGGSSGGSAAAVAARLCPIALGSDTGGSIRQPAAFCGISGFKPSYGVVSRYGLIAYGSSLDHIGPFATEVKDIALMMEVIGKKCNKDSTSLSTITDHYVNQLDKPLGNVKVGIPWHFLEGLDPEIHKNFQDSLDILKDIGCQFVDIDLDILQYSIAVYYLLVTAEASTNLACFDAIRFGNKSKRAKTLEEVVNLSRQEGFGEEVKRRIMLGTYILSAGYQDAYYRKAQKVRTLIIEQFKKSYQSCDMIVTPTAPFPAFEIGQIQDSIQMYLQDIYTVPVNLAGLPAISIPSGFCQKSRPLALQIIGPFLKDSQVLHLAHQFEQKTKYTKKIPPAFDEKNYA